MTRKRLTLQPLTLSNTIDLSFSITREYSGMVMKCVFPFLILDCSFVFVTSFWYDWPAWNMLLAIFLSLLPLGNLLVWTIAKQELIEPQAISDSFKESEIKKSRISIMFRGLWNQFLVGVAGLFMVLPGIWLASKKVFGQEQKCFDEAESNSQQAAWKLESEVQSMNLFGNIVLLFFFWLGSSLLLFLAVDIFTSLVLSFSFVLEGWMEGVSLWMLFATDPYVMTLFTACLLLTYPLVRFAWMLCYISIRVRCDCWDIATRIKRELKRLQLNHEP